MGTQSQTTSVFMSVSRLRSCWIGRTSHSTSTEHKGASATVSWGYRWLRANPGENKQDQLLRRGHPDSLSPEQQNQWILCSKFRTLVEQLSRYPTWALCSQILMRSNEQAWQDWRKKAHHSPPSSRSPVQCASWSRVDSMPSRATNLWEAEERLRKKERIKMDKTRFRILAFAAQLSQSCGNSLCKLVNGCRWRVIRARDWNWL